jgi:hypothetical protein
VRELGEVMVVVCLFEELGDPWGGAVVWLRDFVVARCCEVSVADVESAEGEWGEVSRVCVGFS